MSKIQFLEFYHRTMLADEIEDLDDIAAELQEAVVSGSLSDDKEIMILNLAVQVRTQHFMIKSVAENSAGTTIMFMGDMEDFDPEQMKLDEMMEEELEDFKDGNVVSMKDFGKKKDEE